MSSSQIPKHEMKFYVEIIFWENILFVEICIIIGDHFSIQSEEKIIGSAAFSGRSAIVSFPSFRRRRGSHKAAGSLCGQIEERGPRRLCRAVRGGFPRPGQNTFPLCPPSPSVKAVLPLRECFAEPRLSPCSGDCYLSL